jgi:hypothetical protein
MLLKKYLKPQIRLRKANMVVSKALFKVHYNFYC